MTDSEIISLNTSVRMESEVVEKFDGPCRGRTYGPLIKSDKWAFLTKLAIAMVPNLVSNSEVLELSFYSILILSFLFIPTVSGHKSGHILFRRGRSPVYCD